MLTHDHKMSPFLIFLNIMSFLNIFKYFFGISKSGATELEPL